MSDENKNKPFSDFQLSFMEEKFGILENDLNIIHERIDMLREDLSKYLNALMDEQIQTYERIKNLEKAVFPNLTKDLNRLRDIVGPFKGEQDHPKDRRDP